ncbi:hypothetical protein P8605_12915 [Streptomyces sp. T-3]|nr:hypothetical protein [Streptomyces sp. T-3]
MSGRFPELGGFGPLSAAELAALRSLHHAYAEMEQELQTARAMTGRLAARADLAADEPGGPGAYYASAVGELCSEALDFERKVGELAWRTASASMMVSIAVWHRLLTGQSPLADQAVAYLASHEPTLGELKTALEGPYAEVLDSFQPEGEQPGGEGDNRDVRAALHPVLWQLVRDEEPLGPSLPRLRYRLPANGPIREPLVAAVQHHAAQLWLGESEREAGHLGYPDVKGHRARTRSGVHSS